MATKQPLISCPNCGQEFELDKAFAEHFEDEKRKAVAQAIDTFKKKTNSPPKSFFIFSRTSRRMKA